MDRPALSRAQRWTLGSVAAAAVVAIVALVVTTVGDDDDSDVATDGTTSTSTTESTTTTSTSSSTTVPDLDVDPFSVIFPDPTSSRRFDSPETVANAFAEDVVGMVDPVLGTYRPADSRSGEQPLSDRPGRPETTVLVRQMEDQHWYVLGATTADIIVDQPVADDRLATPFATSGRALAFEGTVDVVVLAQGDTDPRGTGFVTGSGMPPPGPFDGRISFSTPPTERPGVIVYRTTSAEDGHVERASAVRVRLSTDTTPATALDCLDELVTSGEAVPAEERVVSVYFGCGGDTAEAMTAVPRTIPADTPGILRATLTHLFAGPKEAERDAGFRSVFPIDGAEILGLTIRDGVARIDLSAALGSADDVPFELPMVLTATQFGTVARVQLLYEGQCVADRPVPGLGTTYGETDCTFTREQLAGA